jgi:hypothetical protein
MPSRPLADRLPQLDGHLAGLGLDTGWLISSLWLRSSRDCESIGCRYYRNVALIAL